MVESHHDMILSTISLPITSGGDVNDDILIAPKVENSRVKVLWQDDSILDYQAQVAQKLSSLRNVWSNSSSKSSLSILIDLSNTALTETAVATNKHNKLGKPKPVKKPRIPAEIRRSQAALRKSLKQMTEINLSGDAELIQKTRVTITEARRKYKLLTRRFQHKEDLKRDTSFFGILSTNPKATFKSLKKSKSNCMGQVPFLKVGPRTYGADHIHDGHFDSISHLKSQDKETLHPSPSYQFYCQDYENILKICNDKKVLPPISLEASNKILFKMKSQVNDFFSITPMHYINAGCEGLLHFNYLLNYVINDVNLASVEELNVVYALLLHKGHGKLKTLDRSYRTISTCPFLSKGLDLYIHDLYISVGDKLQAPTQY